MWQLVINKNVWEKLENAPKALYLHGIVLSELELFFVSFLDFLCLEKMRNKQLYVNKYKNVVFTFWTTHV
jgi:hypothetical protein